MIDIYFALIFLLGVLFQLLCGGLGLYLPVVAVLIFYAATVTGTVRGIIYSLVFGIIIDIFMGWGFPWSTLACLAIVFFAGFWGDRQMLRPAIINFFPGMIAAAVQLLFLLPGRIGSGFGSFLWSVWLPVFVAGIIFGAVFLPLTVTVLDYFSFLLKLPRYQDARKHQENPKSRWRL